MRGSYKANDPYTFSRAAYDELRDAEIDRRMHIGISIEPTGQRGVWTCRVSAWPIEGQPGGRTACGWEGAWPNSQGQSWEAFLYAAVHRVARMCEEYRLDEERRAAGKANRR